MWRPSSELERLRLEVELAELEAGGVAYGLAAAAPATADVAARRDRLPQEAHVDFDAIERDLDGTRDRVAGVALAVRPALLEALLTFLDRDGGSPLDALGRIRLAGPTAVPGATELVVDAAGRIAGELIAHAQRAAVRVQTELLRSGMPADRLRVIRRLAAVAGTGGSAGALNAQAGQVAYAPVGQLLDAAVTAAAAADGPGARTVDVTRAIAAAAAGLSDRGVVDVASQAVNRAAGLGRGDGAGDVELGAGGDGGQVLIYASELLDRSTCYPCALVDGSEYPTEAAAAEDYPFGQYDGCLGGSRCRGMLVYVWSAEAAPTLGMPR